MKKTLNIINDRQYIFSPNSAILDIDADGFYWRTSPLISMSVIRCADKETISGREPPERSAVSMHDDPTHISENTSARGMAPLNETVLISEKEADEYDMLLALPEMLSGIDELITFNGSSFDIPFLRGKLKAYELPDPFENVRLRDLFIEYRSLSHILGLPSRKLSDYYEYIVMHRAENVSGSDGTMRHNKSVEKDPPHDDGTGYEREPLPAASRDARRTLGILGFDSLLNLRNENMTLTDWGIKGDAFTMILMAQDTAPCRISLHDEPFHFIFENNKIKLSSRIHDGSIRFYHSDIKNYYYLPNEGFAVYRALGDFVDPAHREKATRETCFTNLPLTDVFLKNKDQITAYASSAVKYILHFPSR